METLSDLMRKADSEQRASAVKYIQAKEKLNPPVNAPYVMKHQAECDYFG